MFVVSVVTRHTVDLMKGLDSSLLVTHVKAEAGACLEAIS